MISLLLAAFTYHASCSGLPLTPGASWTYRAAVSWTPAGATAPRDSVVTWVTTVISAVRNDSVVVAAVRDWPTALAWWEPSRQPHTSLIACRVRVGALFGRDSAGHADALYAWTVESAAPVEPRLRALVATAAESSYTVARRTLSDHQVVDYVPGLGLTRYRYAHHGVVSEVDAVLIAYRLP